MADMPMDDAAEEGTEEVKKPGEGEADEEVAA